MKNRTTKVALSIFAIAIASIFFSEYSSQAIGNNGTPPSGRSGSPGDFNSNCSSCHGSATTSYTTSITSNIPASGYISGTTYTVNVNVSSGSTTKKFGFECSPQTTSSTKAIIGTVAAMGTDQVNGTGYISHNGGQVGTSYTWQFKWTAPGSATQTGANATTNKANGNFYASILIANNNGNNDSGDNPQQTNATITENTNASVIITASATTVCVGSSVTFTATPTNGGGGPTYQWQVNGSAASGTNNGVTYTSTSLANNDAVTCILTSNKTGVTASPATSNSITMTVNSGSSTITGTTGGSTCGSGTVTLGASASAGTINWYAASTGGTSIHTGTSYTTPSITATTNYYVDATNGGCASASRVIVTATVNTAPTISGVTPNSRCSTGTVVLGATSTDTINWYATLTGGNSLATGSSFTTPSIPSTTTYYVDATKNGCTTSSRTSVTATISGNPTITATTPNSRCSTGTVVLGATASAGTINWYANLTGGASLATAPSYTTTSISSTTTYYVDATNGGCTTSSRTAVKATIHPLPTATISGSATICKGASSAINIALTGTSPWSFTYGSAGGSNPVSGITSSTYTTNVSAGTYTVSAVSDSNSCIGTYSGSAAIVERTPVAVTNSTITCNGTNTNYTVKFNITGGNPTTYTVTGGGGGTLTGSSFTSNTVASGSSYSFTADDSYHCNPIVVSGTKNCNCAATGTMSGGGTICSGNVATISIALTGTSPWSFVYSIGGVKQPKHSNQTTSPYTFTTSTTAAYTLDSISDANCMGSPSGSASVSQTLPTATLTGGGTVCAGLLANLNIALTGTSPWNYTYSDGTNTTSATSGISNFSISKSTAGTYTITSISDASCQGTSSGSAKIIVNALPTVGLTVTPSSTICAGVSVTLSGTGATSYAWSDGVTNGTPFTPVSTLTYTVTGTDGNSCSNKATQTVTVNALPLVGFTASPSSSVCSGSGVTLSGTGATSYSWSGGSVTITNGVSFTPASTQTYTVIGTDGNFCSNKTTHTVGVNATPTVGATASPSSSVCSGASVTLNGIGATTYSWSGGIADGVSFTPASSQTYTVTGTTGNCSNTSTLPITVSSCGTIPAKPIITRPDPGTTLVSNAPTGNQWYLNGVLIPGETNPTLALTQTTQSGNYTVVVTVNGVSSVPSDPINLVNTGIVEISNDSFFKIYPNPSDGNFNVSFEVSERGTYKLDLKNLLGQSIYQETLTSFNGAYLKELSIADYGQGVYMISLTSSKNEIIKKIVVY